MNYSDISKGEPDNAVKRQPTEFDGLRGCSLKVMFCLDSSKFPLTNSNLRKTLIMCGAHFPGKANTPPRCTHEARLRIDACKLREREQKVNWTLKPPNLPITSSNPFGFLNYDPSLTLEDGSVTAAAVYG